jgi:GTP-binding protein
MINNGFGDAYVLNTRVPSRGLIGFRGEFLTETKGTGLLNTLFLKFDKWQGDMRSRPDRLARRRPHGRNEYVRSYNLKERGVLFRKAAGQSLRGVCSSARTPVLSISTFNCDQREKSSAHAYERLPDEAMRLGARQRKCRSNGLGIHSR